MTKLAVAGIACVSIASAALLGARGPERWRSGDARSGKLSLNALDYGLNLFDHGEA